MRYGKRAIAVITLIIKDAERKHLMLAAAGLAFYFLMSLFPALVLLAAGAAYLPLQDGLQGLTSFLVHVMPPQGLSMIENILATIGPHRSELLSFGMHRYAMACLDWRKGRHREPRYRLRSESTPSDLDQQNSCMRVDFDRGRPDTVGRQSHLGWAYATRHPLYVRSGRIAMAASLAISPMVPGRALHLHSNRIALHSGSERRSSSTVDNTRRTRRGRNVDGSCVGSRVLLPLRRGAEVAQVLRNSSEPRRIHDLARLWRRCFHPGRTGQCKSSRTVEVGGD